MERRLAGPGLGDATAKWILAVAAGRSSSRRADSIPTTVGGYRAWCAMRRTQWGMPDKPPLPLVLLMLLILVAVIGIRRREESSIAPLPQALINIALEEEEGVGAGGTLVDAKIPDVLMVAELSCVTAVALSPLPLPSSPPP